MSDYIIHGDSLEDIADAIREKTGTSSPIAVGDMPDLISRISGGSANIWTGTQAEYEAQSSQIADDTVVLITDDEQEVVEGGTIYSEDEQCIGLWIDKRPLYQKTYVFDASVTVSHESFTNLTTFTIPTGIDYVRNAECFRIGNKGLLSIDCALIASGGSTYIAIRNSSAYDISVASGSTLTITYTKATDAPLDAVVGRPITFNLANGYADYSNKIYEESYTTTSADYNYEYTATEDCFVVFSNVNGANNESYARVMKDTEILAEVYSSYSSQLIQSGGSTFLRKGEKLLIHSTYQNAQLSIRVYGINVLGVKPVINYSTDEQVIGTWIDGSTLYEKTFTGLSTNTNGTSWVEVVGTDIDNLNEIVNASIYSTVDNKYSKIPIAESQAYNNKLRVSIVASVFNRKITMAIIQYTKTS